MRIIVSPKEIVLKKADLFEIVKSETISKVYNPAEYSSEREEILRTEFAFVHDDRYWFNEYLREACANVSEKMSSLNKSDMATLKLDDEQACFLITVVPQYNADELIEYIRSYIKYYIVYRWFMMKGRNDVANTYEIQSDNMLKKIRSKAIKGVDATAKNAYGSIAQRDYNIM